MKVTMTGAELIQMGLWDRYCEATGTSEWAISEGRLDTSEEVEIPFSMYGSLTAAIEWVDQEFQQRQDPTGAGRRCGPDCGYAHDPDEPHLMEAPR